MSLHMVYNMSPTNRSMQTLRTGWKTHIKMHSIKEQVLTDPPGLSIDWTRSTNLYTTWVKDFGKIPMPEVIKKNISPLVLNAFSIIAEKDQKAATVFTTKSRHVINYATMIQDFITWCWKLFHVKMNWFNAVTTRVKLTTSFSISGHRFDFE